MSDNLKDILSNLNPDINQEMLMRYLQGKLSATEQHEIEKQMADNDFDTDALEGLNDFKNKQQLDLLVKQLKKDLRKKTDREKAFRQKLTPEIQPWLIVAIILILLLAVIGYMIVHKQLHS